MSEEQRQEYERECNEMLARMGRLIQIRPRFARCHGCRRPGGFVDGWFAYKGYYLMENGRTEVRYWCRSCYQRQYPNHDRGPDRVG